jgi:ribose transport system substrate-binding protein
MTRRTRFALFLLTLTVTLLPCGCGPTGPTGRNEGKPRITLIMKSLANPFFKTMEDGARSHQAANAGKYDLKAVGIPDERDMAKQISYVEQNVAQRAAAIVIAPADSKGLVIPCKRAVDAGVVVVNIDNKLDAEVLAECDVKIPFVGPDNRAGAKKVGDYLATRLQPGDKVAIIEGIATAFNSQQRRQGFVDAMENANIKVETIQSGEWETAKADTIASSIIANHPNLKAILCANDNMALGAVAALRGAGKKPGEILVVGFDNIPAIRELLKEGYVVATADQHADQLAVFGIEYALQILDGQSTPEDKETPVDLITADDVR